MGKLVNRSTSTLTITAQDKLVNLGEGRRRSTGCFLILWRLLLIFMICVICVSIASVALNVNGLREGVEACLSLIDSASSHLSHQCCMPSSRQEDAEEDAGESNGNRQDCHQQHQGRRRDSNIVQ